MALLCFWPFSSRVFLLDPLISITYPITFRTVVASAKNREVPNSLTSASVAAFVPGAHDDGDGPATPSIWEIGRII